MSYAFTHMRNSLLLLLLGLGLLAGIWTLRLGFGELDWDLGFKPGIWAQGWDLSLAIADMEGETEISPHLKVPKKRGTEVMRGCRANVAERDFARNDLVGS